MRAQQALLEERIEAVEANDPAATEQSIDLLELARNAHRLFDQQPPSEKRRLLDFVCSKSSYANAELEVTYRQPFSPALQGWEALLIQPRHRFRDRSTAEPDAEAVGTGPFRLQGRAAGRDVVLVANPNYWNGRPHLDRIVFRIVPDLRTEFGALLAGELDMAPLPPGEDPGQPGRTEIRYERFHTLGLSFIAWNSDGSNPFFSDPNVRRAMTLALDRAGFLRSAWVLPGVLRRPPKRFPCLAPAR